MTNPSAKPLLQFYRQALQLKRLPRTGWLQRGVALPESVAEHSFGVALLALIIGDMVEGVDHAKLLRMAMLHDLAEAHLTDLPASASHFLGKAVKRQAEQQAFAALVGPLPDAAAYLQLWAEYADGASPEARLVKALDRIELLAQALAYEQAGQRGLDEFWHAAAQGWEEFPLLRDLAAEMITQRPL